MYTTLSLNISRILIYLYIWLFNVLRFNCNGPCVSNLFGCTVKETRDAWSSQTSEYGNKIRWLYLHNYSIWLPYSEFFFRICLRTFWMLLVCSHLFIFTMKWINLNLEEHQTNISFMRSVVCLSMVDVWISLLH